MPPQISLTELYNLKSKRELSKHVSYDKIIESCHKKIKKIANIGGTNIFFEIPFIIIGLPLYDIHKCIEYVVTAIRKNGLFVQILPQPNFNFLYISWSPADVNIKKQKLLEGNGNNEYDSHDSYKILANKQLRI